MLRSTFPVLLVIAIAGCASQSGPYARPAGAAAPPPAPATQTSVGTPSWMKASDYHAGGPVPVMEPNRRISDQDCTQGVQLETGNLRCKPPR